MRILCEGPVIRTTGPLRFGACANVIHYQQFCCSLLSMLKPTILSLLLLSTLLVTQVQAAQRYGAIAISRSGDWGVATNYLSVSSAEREALRSCGDVNCTIRVSFRGCGAVAERDRSLAQTPGSLGAPLRVLPPSLSSQSAAGNCCQNLFLSSMASPGRGFSAASDKF